MLNYNRVTCRNPAVPLADQIRKYRIEQGLSLSELARRSKISRGYPSQLEKKPSDSCPSANILGDCVHDTPKEQSYGFLYPLVDPLQRLVISRSAFHPLYRLSLCFAKG